MKRAKDIDITQIDTDSAEFQNALKLIQYTRQSVFLTGKAGTGKSTFLKYLTHTTKKKYVVLAPTGIAAVNAGGQTIHSFFKLPFKPMLPDDPDYASVSRLKQRLHYSKQTVKMLRALQLIIIDEVSMVRADTIDFIDRVLRVYSGNQREPFGGKQLLLVGDVFQLEPVVTGDMRDVLSYHYKDGTFFFNARAFEQLSVVPIELTKAYRQTDPEFISLLDRIRVGQPLPEDIAKLNGRIVSYEEDPSDPKDFTMTIATRRDIVDRLNEANLAKIDRPERTYVGAVTGEFPENSLPTDMQLVLKEGAQVVFVRNDPDRRWVNGTIGKVAELNAEEIVVKLEDGTRHDVKAEVWENVKYEYNEEAKKVVEKVIGSFKQLPVKLAWALTIHKSQGLTFDRIIIDVGSGAFSGGQTYVALSRCRTLQGISMRSTVSPRDIFVNNRVVRFSQTFNNDWLIRSALENAHADDCYHRASECFDKGDYGDAVRLFADAVCAHNVLDREDVVRLIAMKMASMTAIAEDNRRLREQLEQDNARFRQLATEYVELGEEVRNEGWDIQSAIANYDKAISLSPGYHIAWLCKGMALAQAGSLEEALDCLARAAALDLADYRALYEGGRILVNNGDLSEGMDLLLQALERNAEVPAVHMAIAEGYEKVGDDDNARKHRLIAKKLNKNQKK